MHITNEVDLPEELIQAQREGKLVIFAGTGVSRGKPACLPDYKELTEKILHRKVGQKEAPLDQLLGDQQKKGTNVQRMAKEILDPRRLKYTPLHKALIELFPTPDSVRIVTTNADRLFTKAAKKVFPEGLETFYAPALPLGRDFHGLVYLHGSVEKDPSRMVFTDADFGHAYLTDGWATRFICEVFENYTVLFVGYSHNDTVLKYLARGLPPDTKRFTLTEPSKKTDNELDRQHWANLGVVEIPYPPEGNHIHLTTTVQTWAQRNRMDYLAHERKIQEIVANPPDVMDKVTSDYLLDAVQQLPLTHLFTRHALGVEWLSWANEKHFLDDLFDPILELTGVKEEFATWLAFCFVCEHPDSALAIIRAHQNGTTLSARLWTLIVWELTRRQSQLTPPMLSTWVNLLLSTKQPHWHFAPRDLGMLLSQCQTTENRNTALLLFDQAIQPLSRLQPSFWLSSSEKASNRIDAAVNIPGNTWGFAEAWRKLFIPKLEIMCELIEPLVTSQLVRAYLLESAQDAEDSISSLMRSAIEQNKEYPEGQSSGMDILINAARDIIEALLRTNPPRADAVIDAWADSHVPLLQRLAVHGLTMSEKSADEKIAWILDRKWLYAWAMKHETYMLLRKSYPNASDTTRTTLLDAVKEKPAEHDQADVDELDWSHQELVNLVSWLSDSDPSCSLASDLLSRIRPTDKTIETDASPEFAHPCSAGQVHESTPPFSDASLLAMDASAIVDAWNHLPDDSGEKRENGGVWAQICRIAHDDYSFGFNIARALTDCKDWSSAPWATLFRVWSNASMNTEQWSQLLHLLNHIEEPHDSARAISDLLLSRARSEHGFAPTQLDQVESISDRVFQSTKNDGSGVSSDDLYLVALNHTCGTIAELWIQALLSRRRLAGDEWQCLPESYKQRFEDVLAGDSLGAGLAFVILMQTFAQLAQLDTEWTRTNLLPLLDWSTDAGSASLAWHGYLYGEVPFSLENEMLPCYRSALAHLKELPKTLQGQIQYHVAEMVVHGQTDPVTEDDGWLWQFVEHAPDGSLHGFANHVGGLLHGLSPEQLTTLWNDKLCEYWLQRGNGFPLPFADEEKEDPNQPRSEAQQAKASEEKLTMVQWALTLEPVFESVVDRILASPPPKVQSSYGIYHDLLEKGFAANHGPATAKLVRHLLGGALSLPDSRTWAAIVPVLEANGASHADLLEICNQLCRLGYSSALELADSLKRPQAT